ncbi:DUF4239 domain-containing protein [Actinomycetospora lutea]|uniref:bestrophin-like domain n=1 Tax=Actinomycetospora lutea TaxID=663604 RepID=UPI00236643BF|nr:DUF4239 domain-containing protein [Actinomycetospora lutea]MDD7939498.1 DUF4239 domain-containing protein [Actinomycetospora lutea]
MVVIVVVVLSAAAVVGFLTRRQVFGTRSHDHPLARAEGVTISELVVPARTLAALVLAFVVVSVYSSFDDAGEQAATEAGAVLSMAEGATLLTPPARAEVLGRLTCYTRSVVGPDWRAQAGGAPSPVADAAADQVTAALARAAVDPRNATAVGAILADNSERIRTRIQRFEDGRPSVPTVVWVVLLLSMAVMIGGLAALVHPGVRTGVQVAVLAGTTVVFGLTLLVVHDLDRPYSGPARTEPTAMIDVQRRIAALPGETVPVPVPCDGEGRSV